MYRLTRFNKATCTAVLNGGGKRFMQMGTSSTKKEGDISSVFASLSGGPAKPLPERFATLKQQIVGSSPEQRDALEHSWHRLIDRLDQGLEEIIAKGSSVVPELEFADLSASGVSKDVVEEIKKRGSVVIHNVIQPSQALKYKSDIQAYIKANPSTKAFPAHNPQVYELYHSKAQIAARAHPNLLQTQKFLLGLWDTTSSTQDHLDTTQPLTYLDRLRIRTPGDTSFALGPHIDGGGVERWEDPGYRSLYTPILSGDWEAYDPYNASARLGVEMDMYDGAGACSMFRMWQGWMSMSDVGAREGTLLLLPLLREVTAYFILRPFFAPRSSGSGLRDWRFVGGETSALHGATPGMAQELTKELHPHLRLGETMTHIPRVRPGSYVAWHCDAIHAVDSSHTGTSDSSVLYIPAAPDCGLNRAYLERQKEAFEGGVPPPDFPGGKGESEHVGRGTRGDLERLGGVEGMRAMGYGL
ncbi:hypothetical protein YB2330_003970 [Saitoella coloradoensis]